MNHEDLKRQASQGLSIGGLLLSLWGVLLSVPEYYESWKFVVTQEVDIFGNPYEEEKVFRVREHTEIPPYKVVPGHAERKLTGLSLIFFGGNLAWFFGQAASSDFLLVERRRWISRQSEFVLDKTQLLTGDEVTQAMIELDQLGKLAEYQKGFRPESVSYLPPESTQDEPESGSDGYPETPNGFYCWLKDKEIRQAKVRDIGQKWFNGTHLSSDTIRRFVDSLREAGLAEWLDEGKGEFRLLNT